MNSNPFDFFKFILSSLKSNKNYIFCFFLFSFFLLFFCSEFSPLYEFNSSPDVNIYYLIGKGILFDKIPYRDLFDHKGPIIFFIYALGYCISPNSFLGMYFLSSFFLFISVTVVYYLSKLFLDIPLSILSACLYPVFLMIFITSGGTAEEFILMFLVISLFLFIYFFKKDTKYHNPCIMFIHGMMLSIVFFIKLNLIVFWFFPLLFIFVNLIINRNFKFFLYNAIALLCGILIIMLPICLYFICNNAFSDFFEAYIILNFAYGGVEIVNYWFFICGLLLRFYGNLSGNFICFPILVLGVLFFSFGPFIKQKSYKISILLSFIITTIMLYLPGVVMGYYFVIFTVFFPLGIISILYFVQKKIPTTNKMYTLVSGVGILASFFICVSKKNLFDYSVSELIYRDFRVSLPVAFATEIKTQSGKKSLLCAGLTDGLCVYYLLDLLPDKKYFFTPNVVYDVYPKVFDGQLSVINNKEINFVIMKNNFREYYLYNEALVDNNYVVISQFSEYLLYKLND